MKTILNNKWHLHAIALIFSVLFTASFNSGDEVDIIWWTKTLFGNFSRIFIATFFGCAAGFLCEWLQRVLFNAHEGKEGMKASNMDWLVTTLAAFVGAFLSIFIDKWYLIVPSAIIILSLELYKRMTK